MKTNFLTTAVLGLVMSAGVALAQNGAPMHRHGGAFGGPMFGFFGHQLGLTDTQKAQMKEIMAKEKPTMKPLMQQLGQGQAQLRQLELNNFDEAQARAIATQQAQTMTELSVQRARIEAELIQVLTPDQKTKLTQLWQQRQQRIMNHNAEAPQAQ